MSEKKLAVIGGGQMGRALVGGIVASSTVAADQICLVEPSQASQVWWAENEPEIELTDLSTAVAGSDSVLLAVKPNQLHQVAKQKSRFWNGKLVISIAAGIGLEQLSGWIGHQRIARVMPNTPSLVREGASAFCCGSDVTQQDKAWIQLMLNSVGLAIEVDESQMDAVTGLSGSGPAYVCLVIEALADGGVLAGLPRPIALQLAVQTVRGTATMISQGGRHPGELKDAVASPAGTTIAGVTVLEQNGIRGALIQAVDAAARRSQELGRNE